jgi:predicted transposase/invertase (TIGR01784 family)
MRVLSPTNDLVFKEFLERERLLLRSMLGAVLGEEVADLTLINNELHGELAHDKTIVIDVRVVFRSGKRVIIEMQILVDPSELKPRLVVYTARDFVNQARRGLQHYGSLTPTVTIVWVVKPLFPELHQLHSVFALREGATHVPFSDHLTLHVLQLSEISDTIAVDAAPVERMVHLWARFLRAGTDEERYALAQEDPIMATATETLERISADPDLVRRAEERELSKFFYESSLVNAEAKGKAEGRLEGKAELLVDLLVARFGDLPKPTRARVLRATDDEFQTWTRRVVCAASLEQVFAE